MSANILVILLILTLVAIGNGNLANNLKLVNAKNDGRQREEDVMLRSLVAGASPKSGAASVSTTVPLLNKRSASFAVLACSAMYGSNYVNTKIIQQHLSPSMVTMLRFAIASLFFVPTLVKTSWSSEKEAIKGGIELGVLCAIGFCSQGVALTTTSASKVALFSSLAVVMPPIFALMSKSVHKDASSKNNSNKKTTSLIASSSNSSCKRSSLLATVANSPFVPSLLAFAGAAVLEWGEQHAPELKDLLLLTTPLAFALCFWQTESLAKRCPNSTAVITGTMLVTVTVISSLWALSTGQFPTSTSSLLDLVSILAEWKTLLALLYTGIMCTSWCSYVEQRALKVISAADTTLIYASEPLFATVFAALFLHEKLNWNTAVSTVLIITACLWEAIMKRIGLKHA